ncbi:hypothetical protein XENTR_v10007180 [Xenopus tropicalis]|nr:hypothetical protein XENTR_v10007180 [Xenopus tropicalis]
MRDVSMHKAQPHKRACHMKKRLGGIFPLKDPPLPKKEEDTGRAKEGRERWRRKKRSPINFKAQETT